MTHRRGVGGWEKAGGLSHQPSPPGETLVQTARPPNLLRYHSQTRTPHIPHHSPYTSHPAIHTLNPTIHTLHPTSHTLHPTPDTLHLSPYTLHPKPQLQTLHQEDAGPSTLKSNPQLPTRQIEREIEGEKKKDEMEREAKCTGNGQHEIT